MDAGDWVSLLTCAGALGSLPFFVRAALRGGDEDRPFRPVWLVLLAGGTAKPDRPDDSDGGGGAPSSPSPSARGE